MKKLRKNSGFTLVECLVAMAVLAIMMLGLLMILNAAVKQRNRNTQQEREIDQQVEQINDKNESKVDSEALSIKFGKDWKLNGVHRVYLDDFNMGRFQYGDGSDLPTEIPDPDETEPEETEPEPEPEPEEGDYYFERATFSQYKVYGASQLDGDKVSVTYYSKEEVGNYYIVTWRISFNVTGEVSDQKSVKVTFPSYAKLYYFDYFDKKLNYYNGNGTCKIVHKLGDSTVRMEPSSTGTVTVDVEFVI